MNKNSFEDSIKENLIYLVVGLGIVIFLILVLHFIDYIPYYFNASLENLFIILIFSSFPYLYLEKFFLPKDKSDNTFLYVWKRFWEKNAHIFSSILISFIALYFIFYLILKVQNKEYYRDIAILYSIDKPSRKSATSPDYYYRLKLKKIPFEFTRLEVKKDNPTVGDCYQAKHRENIFLMEIRLEKFFNKNSQLCRNFWL